MDQLLAVKYSYLIPLLPLIAAAISGFFGAKILKQQSHWPIWLGVGTSAVLSISLLFGMLGQSHHAPEATTQGSAHEATAHEATGHQSTGHQSTGHQATGKVADPTEELSKNKPWFDWITAGGSNGEFTSYSANDANHPADLKAADGTVNGLKTFYVQAGAWIDSLTAVMLCVVCGIGFFITVFAAGYMKGESGYFRFFAYLGLFIFSMTCLVMGSNFVMLYLGWEGVGLCSYLLIGYYYEKPAAREAAKKAFLVNRIGDFGFGLGIMLIFLAFGTVSFFGNGVHTLSGVIEMAQLAIARPDLATPFQATALKWIPFLLMLGAFGKSAQFPLYVWLPDAMEGPTPVSALIHAATMVTAGVYMIARCGTLFVGNQAAMWTVAVVGAFTAIFAASIALRQFDLKKVFAYSTISQLGFMFVGVGCLVPVAGVFHLITHAFFKALLFLSSGVVMHAMAGELDMRKFSGLKKVLPKTRWLMLIGCAALAGFPFLSGFFSKDEIVGAAWHANHWLGAVMLLTAFMTAYYTFRLYFRVFEGPEVVPAAPAHAHGHGTADSHAHAAASDSALRTHTADASGVDNVTTHKKPADPKDSHGHGDHHHNHEPGIMMLPLYVLAIGAILAGYLNWPKEGLGHFLGLSPSIAQAYDVAVITHPAPPGELGVSGEGFGAHVAAAEKGSAIPPIMLVSALISIAGILLAYQLHLKDRKLGDRIPQRFGPLTRLLEGKFWVDEVYQMVIVEPLRALGRAFFLIDRWFVDGLVWLTGFIPQASGFALKLTTQRGYLQGYAASMLFGLAIILLVIFW